MADSIQVSTQVLVDTAEKVRSINNTLDQRLNDINKSMNDLEATWKSDAATDIRAAMNALRPRFEESGHPAWRKAPRFARSPCP